MKRILSLLIVAVVAGLSATPLFAQEMYYVQSVKARIMSTASFKSTVIGEVAKGTMMESFGKAGSWVKVKYQAKEGFVYALLLSPRPPLEKIGLIKSDSADINQGVRRRASTYTSAAAARGLTSDERKRSNREEEVDYRALEKMEAFTLRSDEIAKFQEGGKP